MSKVFDCTCETKCFDIICGNCQDQWNEDKQQIADLERQLKEANERSELEHVWGENWQKDYSEQFDKNVELQQQLQAAKSEHTSVEIQLKKANEDLMKDITRLENELTQLRQERDEQEKVFADMGVNYKSILNENDTLRAEVERLNNQINGWQNELIGNLCETEPEIVALRTRVQELEVVLESNNQIFDWLLGKAGSEGYQDVGYLTDGKKGLYAWRTELRKKLDARRALGGKE